MFWVYPRVNFTKYGAGFETITRFNFSENLSIMVEILRMLKIRPNPEKPESVPTTNLENLETSLHIDVFRFRVVELLIVGFFLT